MDNYKILMNGRMIGDTLEIEIENIGIKFSELKE